LNGIRANDTPLFMFERILNDMGAFIANLTKLTDFVNEGGSVDTWQFYLIGKAFVKVMAAEGAVFVDLFTHQN